VQRVSVVGNSGSGKSRLASRVAQVLGVPYIELDAIHHLPGWEPIDPALFAATVGEIAETDGWVIDGNYRTVVVEGPVWARADTVVWLDLPRWRVMSQVIRRTLTRLVRREELWNGNREPLRTLWAWNPERSIIRWAWTRHATYVERYERAMASPSFQHLEFLRFRSHEEAERWLESLTAAAAA
jgi:adenylate kinase family enzyme